jgi:hypothetical protein
MEEVSVGIGGSGVEVGGTGVGSGELGGVGSGEFNDIFGPEVDVSLRGTVLNG